MDDVLETPAQAWSRCRPYIEATLKHQSGGYTVEDVWIGIERGQFHFWAGERAAIVTEFWTTPRLKLVNFWLGGGDLKELMAMRPQIEAWAIRQGCGRAVGGGLHDKRGWGRVLASCGYRPAWTVYSKE